MNRPFTISTDWLSCENGTPEVRATSANISMALGELLATRHQDEWSQSVRSSIRLAAYPLAIWFTSNWWRLLWEPSTAGLMRAEATWRMAHEMTAVGHGFIWPRLVFDSDGQRVEVHCLPSPAITREPIKYLERFDTSVSIGDFERAMDRFVSLTISRLGARGLSNTDLHGLWAELSNERGDPDSSRMRRLEARLGFDPDDAPDNLLQRLTNLTREAGAAAIDEIAPACAGQHAAAKFSRVLQLSKSAGVPGKFSIKLPKPSSQELADDSEPWRWSKNLAREVRKQIGSRKKPLSDRELADLLSIDPEVLEDSTEKSTKPLGLAVLENSKGKAKFIFHRPQRTGRRFEAVRFLADSIIAPREDRWLPATDAKTSRQKAQRAFAAEFLCPIDSLVEYLEGDYSSEDAINDAAEHFGISTYAIMGQLQNNNVIGSAASSAFE